MNECTRERSTLAVRRVSSFTRLDSTASLHMAKSSPVKQETSRTMILSKMVSVLWMHLCMFTEIQGTYSG